MKSTFLFLQQRWKALTIRKWGYNSQEITNQITGANHLQGEIEEIEEVVEQEEG